ncbi:uncharacterized protein AB675_5195 [Cyphellophora attinorum]|uniref:Uncharacterized protein n=1 Tax=Cyphellophora attinorum TaxID=1664694 RepID=A0A0N1H8G9_9EURO|nr:uncharacterized protein AB675_5195 [Phialophora attinorum]KPI39420.1 hypothetical protein AB675_5195 [Phialophora attinorum]
MPTPTAPLLRLALIPTTITGLAFSATLVADGQWHFHAQRESMALLAFYAFSLLLSCVLIGLGHRFGTKKLQVGFGNTVPIEALYGAVDLLLGIAFLVLHVVINARVADDYYRVSMVVTYNAFAALTASALHFILAMYSLALALPVQSILQSWEAWQMSMSDCPACTDRTQGRVSIESDESVKSEGRMTRGGQKGKMSVANEEGEGEGDRLIMVDEGEA